MQGDEPPADVDTIAGITVAPSGPASVALDMSGDAEADSGVSGRKAVSSASVGEGAAGEPADEINDAVASVLRSLVETLVCSAENSNEIEAPTECGGGGIGAAVAAAPQLSPKRVVIGVKPDKQLTDDPVSQSLIHALRVLQLAAAADDARSRRVLGLYRRALQHMAAALAAKRLPKPLRQTLRCKMKEVKHRLSVL